MADAPTNGGPTNPYKPALMLSKPGVTRDGTLLARDTYSEMQWSRIYQGRPRKMGGYRQLVRGVNGIIRAFSAESFNGLTYVHFGTQSFCEQFTINNQSGISSATTDRTPADFDADPLNNWQFTTMWDTASDFNLIMAHAAPNIMDISDGTERLVYFGHVEDPDILEPITSSETSGGCVAIINYLIVYGNDGVVRWSVENNPTNLTGTGSGSGRPVANKIVRGLPLRGSGGPAALLWSLDSVIIMQWVGGVKIFDFDTITTASSILSSNGVIENNGIYYWASTTGFLMFNGVVRDIPNDYNRQWFLKNLNWAYRQKMFVFKSPAWNEIWWCFPAVGSTECNWAIIYNYAENVWFDTELPTDKRSAGIYAKIYHYPIMSCAGARHPELNKSNVWQMEYGVDEISGAANAPMTPKAIPSWFETHEFNYVEPGGLGQLGENRGMSTSILEPDFDQVGDLELTIRSRYNARQRVVSDAGPLIIKGGDYAPNEELLGLKHTGRLVRYRITSNTLGGDYVAGSPLVHIAPSDRRMQST